MIVICMLLYAHDKELHEVRLAVYPYGEREEVCRPLRFVLCVYKFFNRDIEGHSEGFHI